MHRDTPIWTWLGLLAAGPGAAAASAGDGGGYAREIARRRREASPEAGDGRLTGCGPSRLGPGEARIGSDPGNRKDLRARQAGGHRHRAAVTAGGGGAS